MAVSNEAYQMDEKSLEVEAAQHQQQQIPSLNDIIAQDEIEIRCVLYEKTLASCGFGRFQIILFLVCGWALASDSAEVQVVSFVLPTACDLEMTSHQKGLFQYLKFDL